MKGNKNRLHAQLYIRVPSQENHSSLLDTEFFNYISAFIYLCRSPQSCPKTGIYGCSVRHTHRQKHCIS